MDMAKEKLIKKEEALLRIDPKMLDTLLHPTLDPNAQKDVIAKGLPVSRSCIWKKSSQLMMLKH